LSVGGWTTLPPPGEKSALRRGNCSITECRMGQRPHHYPTMSGIG
jgi:hypothetical protein